MLLTEIVVPKIVSVMIVQIKCVLRGPEAIRMKPQTLKIPATLTLQETCAGEDASLGNKDEGYFSFDEAVRYCQRDLICFLYIKPHSTSALST